MSQEKDIFSDIVRDRLDGFEVPYNKSHWEEMNDQLDKVQPQSSGGSSPASTFTKYAIVSGIAAAVVVGYFLLNPVEKAEDPISAQPIMEKQISPEENASGLTNLDKEEVLDEKFEEEVTTDNAKSEETVESPSTETLDEKEERFASYSEEQIKEEAKVLVDQEVATQKSEIPTDQKFNNSALKTNIELETSNIHCEGSPVQFKVDRKIEGAQYYWNFGDKGLTSRKMNPKHVFKHPGTFTITLLVSKGEKNDYKEESIIVIAASPQAKIEWEEKQLTLSDPYMEFSASSDQPCSFEWLFNETMTKEGSDALFLIENKQAYDVRLIAKMESGCSHEIHKTYHADKGVTMIVEDAFTPNNDGLNDDFIPNELKSSNVKFTMIVRNLSGQQVFETHERNNAWNGRMNNTGNLLPVGSYHWIVVFEDSKGASHKQEGKIRIQQ